MARIRSLKPEFWQDEALARCSVQARFLFVGLISHADDEGRQRGSPRLILANVLPYDEDVGTADVGGWIDELAGQRLIITYEFEGQRYIAIRSWDKHQRVDHPKRSALPPPPCEIPANGHIPEARGNLPEALAPDKEGDKDKEGSGNKVRDPTIVGLCERLAEKVGAIEGTVPPTPKAVEGWYVACDRLLRIDGRTPEQIAYVIDWVHTPGNFWRKNVQSMPTLREKWNRLVTDIQDERDKRKRRGGADAGMRAIESMMEG